MSSSIRIVVGNMKKRISGVSITIRLLQPLLALWRNDIGYVGADLPGCSHKLSAWQVVKLCLQRTRATLILHARRDHEVVLALVLRAIALRPVKIVFTWAAQRHKGRFSSLVCRQVDAMIATSEAAACFTPFTTKIIPHGVAVPSPRPAKDFTKPKIAIIGRVRLDKGTDLFVKALLQNLDYPFEAFIIGQTRPPHQALKDSLQDLIAAHNAGDRFHWIDFMAYDALQKFLCNTITHVVACSRYEGFGLTIFEGAAAGCALIGTETGAFPSMVGTNQRGLLVPCDNVDALADALRTLLTGPKLSESYAAAAHAFVLEHYSIAHEARAIAALYDELLASEAA